MENSMFLVTFGLAWVTVSFFLFWPLFLSFLKSGEARKIIWGRYYGFFLFGIIPVAVCLIFQEDLGTTLGFAMPKGPILWHLISIMFVIVLIPLTFYQAKKTKNQIDYPQIREKNWTNRLIIANIFSWMIYLIGYEILFRGLLLFPIEAEFGILIAIILNAGFYSLTHMAKGLRESIGALPIGILLVIIAIKTQSIFYPLIIHIVMAVGNSVSSIIHHPEMKIVNKS